MLILLALLGCTPVEVVPTEWPEVVPGPPIAGAAEGTLDLPIGTPLGGYSARCGCLTGVSKQDSRDSQYSEAFVESTGIHMRPTVKVIWLENGDEHLVLASADVIYAYDGLVEEIRHQLERQTGLDLEGQVVLHTNHSHHSYGPFSDQTHFYLGGDYYNEEIFRRFAADVVEVALEAFEHRQPAAIGTGWAKDWDPDDEVYRDRRGENDDLTVLPGFDNGKDPYLNVLRIDDLQGDPIAIMYTFGIHGIVLSEDNSLISPDATGGIVTAVQEAFDERVVVMHAQGSGGDASPAGRDDAYARVESLGELARDRILDLWERTPTSSDPIALETASRHIWQHHSQIRVTRDGAVDWYYAPIDEDEDFESDGDIYDASGKILSPIDEFNAPYGAAFCGDGGFDFPVGGIGSEVPPYSACMDVELVTTLLYAFFDLPDGSIELPLRESFKAGTTASRFGPIPTLTPEGEEVTRELLIGFFPGEPLAMYGEQWRRRVEAELGWEMPLLVGYAQDHEGYLLIPEDWLTGGYEPNIAIWGPLQGEHIMEGVLSYAGDVLATDVHEDPDPHDWYETVSYPERDLPTAIPDTTPTAGTRLTEPPAYYWIPEGFTLDLAIPDEVPRVQGAVQVGWIGGDPAVDLPVVALERQAGEDWVAVTSHSGRPITDTFQDILVGWTPDPLYPASAEQTHYWWTVWQAVGHDHDRAGLPLGTYRLRISGQRWTGGNTTWPWSNVEPYEVLSDPFEVVPAEITVEAADGGLWASIPADGYRLVDINGDSRGANPVRGSVTIAVDGVAVSRTATQHAGGRSFFEIDLAGAQTVTVTDTWGNTGTLEL